MTRLLCSLLIVGQLALFSSANGAVVIQYHHVSDHTPEITSVTPDRFEQHMAYLADNDFTVWALPRLIRALRSGQSVPKKVIAISFDDGYESVYHEAWPVLRKHGFPFTVFVNSGLVGGSGFMDWEQLRTLADSGTVTVGNHTVSHPHLVRLRENETRSDWRRRIRNEIENGETAIKKHLGRSPGLLAYPYGEYNNGVEEIVRDLGLVAFAQNSGAFDSTVNWHAVPRFAFGGRYAEMEGFINKVNSRAMPLEKVSARVLQGRRLDDPLLPLTDARPTLVMKLESPKIASGINCFATGQGRIDVKVNGETVIATPPGPLSVGRSHINCTALSDQAGRFYWYSHFFMRRNDDGSWYEEP